MKSAKWNMRSLVLVALLFTPFSLHAIPYYSVLSSTSAVSGGTSDNENTGVLLNQALAQSSATVFANDGHEAIATAIAQPGTLAAGSKATSSSNLISGSSANATASFVDVLTLSGPAGFSGPVMLDFTLDVSGIFAACGSCGAQGNANSTLNVGAPGGSFLNNLSSISYSRYFLGGLNNTSPLPTLASILLTTTIGAEISLSGTLSTSAGAQGIQSFADVNYMSTAHYYVEVLTPGVDLVSASGRSYARANNPSGEVSEPPLGLLLGLGMVMLLSRRQQLK